MYVYIIEAKRTSKNNFGKIVYYTGLTDNPKRRWEEQLRGCKSQFMHRNRIVPISMSYVEYVEDFQKALKRKIKISRMHQQTKKELIKGYLKLNKKIL